MTSKFIKIFGHIIFPLPVLQNHVQLFSVVFPTPGDFIYFNARHVKRPSNRYNVENGIFYTKQALYIATEV